MGRRGIIAGFVSVTLVVTSVALLALPTSARKKAVKRVSTVRLARGVKFTTIVDPKGPWRIRIISIDLSQRSTIDVALAQNRLPGFETTSSMARRHGAIAAINGDYSLESGRPVFTFAEDGHLAQTTAKWGRNFAVDSTETQTFIGHPKESAWAYEVDAGLQYAVDRVNQGVPRYRDLAQFTPLAGALDRPPRNACSAQLSPLENPRARPSGEPGVQAVHAVTKVRCMPQRMYRSGETVLSAQDHSPRAPEVSALVPGEHVALGWSLGWQGVFDAIGGNPTLVENGRIVVRHESVPFFRRHPRTGVGTTPDGKVLFVTVDGRQRRYSVGMTPIEFAGLFRSLGADWALNLDGGGSTTMVVRGDVKNRPSDGRERLVSSALLLLPGADRGERSGPPAPPPPSPSPSPSPDIPIPTVSPETSPSGPSMAGSLPASLSPWELISTDPASTGGLAWWLARTRTLPPTLMKAVRAFESRR